MLLLAIISYYHKLFVAIILVAIGVYFINAYIFYWWLLLIILLLAISAYSIGVYLLFGGY